MGKQPKTLHSKQESGASQGLYVFLLGLPYESSEKEVRDFFNGSENFEALSDQITNFKMPLFQDSGRCRGFAHVTFSSQDALDAALGLSG
jgi:nucleolin